MPRAHLGTHPLTETTCDYYGCWCHQENTASLDPRPVRQLTDRECAKILGGIIGGLMTMTSLNTLRHAFRWWSENDIGWEAMEKAKEAQRRAQEMYSGHGTV